MQINKTMNQGEYQCERCGGTGEQEAGMSTPEGWNYSNQAGTCDRCHGAGVLGKAISTSLSTIPSLAITAATRSPWLNYLAHLESDASKKTALRCLRMVAVAVGKQPDEAESFDWSTLRYEHVLAIRGLLAERELAPSTINLCLSVIRGIARQCWLLEAMDERTYRLIHTETKGVKGQREQKGRMVPMKDIRKLLKTCDNGTKRGKRDAAIIAILLGAGLRRAEVSWLGDCENVTAFDFDAQSVKVIGKGNKEREVFLFRGTLDALNDWLEVKAAYPEYSLFPAFTGHTDKPLKRGISPQAIYGMLRKRCLEAAIKVIKPHDFRRTNISTQLEQGGDLSVVAAQAGHASTDTTRAYDLRGKQAQQKVAQRCAIPM